MRCRCSHSFVIFINLVYSFFTRFAGGADDVVVVVALELLADAVVVAGGTALVQCADAEAHGVLRFFTRWLTIALYPMNVA